MADDVVIASEADLQSVLDTLARTKRMVFFSGLPGVGKSLFIRELALAAHAHGRTVHLLQWDVARPAFVSPALAARYPEHRRQAHAVFRVAIGLWARRALLRWHEEHDNAHILIGEVPLVGGRMLDLVQVQDDRAEPLLAGQDSLFVMPVPSIAVRAAIENARIRTYANPAHPREVEDAPPDVLRLAWEEAHALAVKIGAATMASDKRMPFDPQAYAAVYRHLLRHRPSVTLWMDTRLEPRGSVYDLGIATNELAPTPDEALGIVMQLEREHSVGEVEQYTARWFENV